MLNTISNIIKIKLKKSNPMSLKELKDLEFMTCENRTKAIVKRFKTMSYEDKYSLAKDSWLATSYILDVLVDQLDKREDKELALKSAIARNLNTSAETLDKLFEIDKSINVLRSLTYHDNTSAETLNKLSTYTKTGNITVDNKVLLKYRIIKKTKNKRALREF